MLFSCSGCRGLVMVKRLAKNNRGGKCQTKTINTAFTAPTIRLAKTTFSAGDLIFIIPFSVSVPA
ncbi:MAG: hypothetical protein C9356_13950 [Oleiphilus sp.]|nr:MAG: hypothetical protein C9356_13950 [Oleiphilus sp.]